MTLGGRKKRVSEKKGCFKCLELFHLAEKCESKINCSWCQKEHCMFMYPFSNNTGRKQDKVDYHPGEKYSIQKTTDIKRKETNMASLSNSLEVHLQTLRIVLYNV